MRGLEVGWQVVNLVELRVGVHGLVVLVGNRDLGAETQLEGSDQGEKL